MIEKNNNKKKEKLFKLFPDNLIIDVDIYYHPNDQLLLVLFDLNLSLSPLYIQMNQKIPIFQRQIFSTQHLLCVFVKCLYINLNENE